MAPSGNAGLRRLSALEKRQTDTAAADFDEGGVGDVEHGVVLQAISNGQVGEPALLGSVDDFDIQAGPRADPIEERVCIGRFAHGAGCHGTDVAHLIAVDDVAKAVQRANGGIDRRRPIRPIEKVSWPRSKPRDASSRTTGRSPRASCATTSRTAEAPISMTAAVCSPDIGAGGGTFYPIDVTHS